MRSWLVSARWEPSLPVRAYCKLRKLRTMRFAVRPAVIWRRALRQIRLSMYRTRMRLQVPGKLNCWDWREPTYKCWPRITRISGGPLPYMGWIMFRELGWKVFRCLKEPLRLRMGMRRWPDKSTWNSRSPLRRIFSLLMCSLVMPDVMKGMRMLLGISTTSSLPVYWYTTRMIKCNMTVMTMVFSIRR